MAGCMTGSTDYDLHELKIDEEVQEMYTKQLSYIYGQTSTETLPHNSQCYAIFKTVKD